jgi:chromosome partitioning protein
MAYVIAVALLKGGVGKTTTAVALAEAAASGGGRVTLIDTDPQGSALRWSQLAEDEGRPLRSTVTGDIGPGLPRRIGPVASGADIVIIDAPPPGALAIANAAIEAADYVVIPVPPQRANLDRVRPTVDAAIRSGKPFRVVLTMVRGGISERDDVMAELTAAGVPVFATELPLTVDVERCYGLPVTGPLARFGVDLMTEILTEVQTHA